MAAPPDDLEIRPLQPGDDPEAQLNLVERAFGSIPAAQRDRQLQSLSWHMATGRSLGAFDGRQPVAGASFHDMRQWWHGRPGPMAGVAVVMVAPEYRGRGVGRRLMTAVLDEIAARGYPLSALFPATMPLYRSLGWELAGARDTVIIPARSLRGLVAPDAAVSGPDAGPDPVLRRAGPGDADAVIAVLGRVHEAARDCGPITRDAATVAEWLSGPDLYSYLAEDGFLAYQWHHGNRDLYVERAEAASGRTVRAFWAHLGSYASTAEKVYARTGPASALWWLTRERDIGIERRSRWMLRVVDAAAAIAARGYPAEVSVRVRVRIADGARPANSGRWQLTVAGGAGTLERLGPDASGSPAGPAGLGSTDLTLGARGLAALYAGTPLVTLRQAGLVADGTPADDAALDAAFAATPYMLDAF